MSSKRRIDDDRKQPAKVPKKSDDAPIVTVSLKRKANEEDKEAKRPKTNGVVAKQPVPIKMVDPDVKKLAVATPDLLRVTNTLYLRKFDIQTLSHRDGKRIGIVGMSGSGKSRLMLEIMRFINWHVPVWMVFNASESGNHMYGPHVEEICIHEKMDLSILEKFKKRQIDRCNKWRVPDSDPPEYIKNPTAGLILDDMMEDTKIFNHPIFGWIFLNSRNFKTFFVLLVQYFMLLPPKYRRNLSHLFLFRQNSVKEIKKIWSEFFGVFEKEVEFRRALEVCTADNGSIVLDILNPSVKISDRVFWYKHTFKQPPFRAGDPIFNAQLREMYDPNWAERWAVVQAQEEEEALREAEEKKNKKKRKPDAKRDNEENNKDKVRKIELIDE
jgi:hypothetical protein